MRQFGIFAKYWRPGAVKTRLAAGVGDELAAEFHLASLRTLVRRFADLSAHRVVSYAPRNRRAEFAESCGEAWTLQPQVSGSLGERMSAYFTAAFALGAERVVLIGSDSPALPEQTIQLAFKSLDDHSLALGPSDDGGYYLVAAHPDAPNIFADIPWSTPQVMLATERRLQDVRASWFRLPGFYDVDRPEDIRRLAVELSVAGPLPVFQELKQVVERCLEAPGRG